MRETQTSIQTRTCGDVASDDCDGFLSQKEGATSELLEVLERVGGKIARGPAPAFNAAHVVKALEIIADYGSVGRISLSNRLELGIGTTRTILKHLKKEELIVSSRNGFAFSEHGKQLFQSLRSRISEGLEVPNSPLSVGPVVIAVLVRDAAHKVGRGVEQRNTAIRVGASGATTLIFSCNKLTMASKRNHIPSVASDILDILVSKLNPKENDAIIVGSGESRLNAEIGAIMAALELLKSEDETDKQLKV
jgi:predicted transcriptional regulator